MYPSFFDKAQIKNNLKCLPAATFQNCYCIHFFLFLFKVLERHFLLHFQSKASKRTAGHMLIIIFKTVIKFLIKNGEIRLFCTLVQVKMISVCL